MDREKSKKTYYCPSKKRNSKRWILKVKLFDIPIDLTIPRPFYNDKKGSKKKKKNTRIRP